MDIRGYIAEQTGLPVAEVVFKEKQKLPYAIIIDKVNEDGDDHHTRIEEHELAIEFYAARIDRKNEEKIEEAITKQGWKKAKNRVWIASEEMFETIYSIKFVEKR